METRSQARARKKGSEPLDLPKSTKMSNKPKCCLCGSSVEDPINLGDMKHCKGYNAHYYCLLLASTIKQSGDDDEGILGFLPDDIGEELKRSKTRICSYCKKGGASVLCNTKHCKIVFHLPCGIANDSEHQFYGRFLSNCVTHRPKQKYTKPKEIQHCPICYDVIDFKNWTKILWAPCCKKKSYFHKVCLKQMALSAGYFFKCPICNNVESFQKTMKHYGVFIPDRDASWELEPNAFEDLLHRHEECNAEVCVCPRGRTYSNTSWNIILCAACGSQGTHLPCSKLKRTDTWLCAVCSNASSSSTQPSSSNTSAVIASSLDFLNQPSGSSRIYSSPSTSRVAVTTEDYIGPSGPRKRKRSSDSNDIVKREKMSSPIEIDSDSDVVVIEEDEPGYKCVLGQDGQLLPVHSISSPKPFSVQGDLNISENEKQSDGLMNIIISDVRSLNPSSPNIKETRSQSPVEKQRVQALNGNQQSEKHYVLCTPANNDRNAKNSVSIIHNQGNVYILKEFIEYHQVFQNNRIIEDQNNQNAGNYNSQDSEIVVID